MTCPARGRVSPASARRRARPGLRAGVRDLVLGVLDDAVLGGLVVVAEDGEHALVHAVVPKAQDEVGPAALGVVVQDVLHERARGHALVPHPHARLAHEHLPPVRPLSARAGPAEPRAAGQHALESRPGKRRTEKTSMQSRNGKQAARTAPRRCATDRGLG